MAKTKKKASKNSECVRALDDEITRIELLVDNQYNAGVPPGYRQYLDIAGGNIRDARVMFNDGHVRSSMMMLGQAQIAIGTYIVYHNAARISGWSPKKPSEMDGFSGIGALLNILGR